MKCAGLVGGIAWPSTLAYYELINREVQQRLGGLHSARLLIASLDFAQVHAEMDAGRPQRAAALMCDAARSLGAAGAEVVAILANTGHFAAEEVEAAAGVPLVHIGRETARGVRQSQPGLRRLGLAGTSYSLQARFFAGAFEVQGFELVLPTAAERDTLDALIFGELARGEGGPAGAARFAGIAQALADCGAEGLVLGCTELRELLPWWQPPLPVFDSTALHARAIVREMLAPAPSH